MQKADNTEASAGRVQIANEVLAKIAATAALENSGVFAMAAGATGGLVRRGGPKPSVKGVRVSVSGQNVSLELNIVVQLGNKIIEVCEDVQARVKTAVETMTGLNVSSVNIMVSGVSAEKEKARKEDKTRAKAKAEKSETKAEPAQ